MINVFIFVYVSDGELNTINIAQALESLIHKIKHVCVV